MFLIEPGQENDLIKVEIDHLQLISALLNEVVMMNIDGRLEI
jgi:hypothetical protein